jgi:hypothetical protein
MMLCGVLERGVFLEAEEELDRMCGLHEQANHTRWKRARAL